MKDPLRNPAIAAMLLLLAGCGGLPPLTPEEMDASYERALARTAARAVELPAEAEPGQLQRLSGFFGAMTPQAVGSGAAALYAPDAYLNDTLVVLEGAPAIVEYFRSTAGKVSSLRVDLLSMAHAGPDYFVRWQMTVVSPRIRDGTPLSSYGMTHFRFDSDGRVLLHRDFWDAGTGLYEHLPVVGPIVRRVRAAAH
jgi:hypothetical protein